WSSAPHPGAARSRPPVPAGASSSSGSRSSSSSRRLRGQPHRVEDLLVARAAADVARERLADLVVRRARVGRQQVGRGGGETRWAKAALHRTRRSERLLHAMEAPLPAETLDRDDLVTVGLRGEHETGADENAVEQHRARAALTLLTGVLRPGEPETLAEGVEEALAAPDVGFLALAVDRQLDPHARHLSRARPARTRRACRR